MNKEDAIKMFGSVEALRQALGLKTRHAIYMCADGEPIPEVHELKIRHVLRPEAFGSKRIPKKRVA
jgi:hypothetical protein